MASELELYRQVVDHFAKLVGTVAPDQWTADTPDEGWTVADLVGHVIERDRMLAATVGGPTPDELDVVDEPSRLPDAWAERISWWEERLADPGTAARTWQTPFGTMTFAAAASAFTVAEVTVHAWDLARAIGADETLPPEAVAAASEQLHSTENTLRRPGVMAPAVEVPDDADPQTRLLAFTGRRP
ncbi:TIGR03086 family metal-binding protein [Jatrophihabitans sp. YIM 134969]